MADAKSPIQSVGGNTSIPTPSAYKYMLQDVSSSDAGRTEDILMHKNRVAQKVKLALEWQNISTSEVATILQAFNAEYMSITYLDAMYGMYRTKTFYVGDRTAPMYNANRGLWSSVSFDVIER